MDSKDIKTITLRVNSEDAAKKLEDLNKKLKAATAAREDSLKNETKIAQTIEQAKAHQAQLNAQLQQGNLYEHEAKRINAELKKTKQDIAKAERDQVKAKKETAKQIKEEAKAQASIDKTRGQYAALERTMQNLGKATVPELKNTIKILERTLNSGAVERGTKEWETFEQQLRECNQELKELEKNKQKIDEPPTTADKAASFGTRWVGFTTMVHFAAQAIDRVTGAARELVEEYAQMDEHLADVTKYTGLSKEAVSELNEAFKQMDTRTSREALNDLAADAGRLGIQSKDKVMEFVQAADMINVALGEDLGEDAVKNIGKLTQLFKVDETLGLRDGMLATASVINELAQTSSASEPYILEFTSRVAGVGYQAGIEQPKIMAFASILDQGMVGVEKGATALQNILTALMRKPAELAKIAGLNVGEFTKLLKTDANAALIQFIEAVNKAGRLDSIAPMLDDMKLSGSGVTQVMATLANNIEQVKQTQDQATDAFREGKSVIEEFDKANATPLAELEKAQKKFRDARIELGKAFAPIASSLVSTSSLSIKVMSVLTKTLIDHKWVVLGLASAWTIYAAVLMKGTIAKYANTIATKASSIVHAAHNSLLAAKTLIISAVQLAYFGLTGRTYAAVKAQVTLNAALRANPFGAILTIISLVVIGYQMLASSSKKATRALNEMEEQQRVLSAAKDKASQSTARERTSLEILLKTVEDGTRSYDERKKALDKLNAAVPEYHGKLSKSGQLERDNRQAVLDYIQALEDKATAEALYDALVEAKRKRMDADRKVNAKQTNVNAVNKELGKSQYISKPVIMESYTGGRDVRVYRWEEEGNQLRVDKLAELNTQQQALTSAQKEYNNALAEENAIIAQSNDPKYKANFAAAAIAGTDTGGGSGYTSDPSKSEQNEAERRRMAKAQADIEKWIIEQQQKAIVEYKAGNTTLSEYRKELLRIEHDALVKKRDIYKKGSVEWTKANTEIEKLNQEQIKRRNEWSIEQLDIEQKEELRVLEERATATAMKEEDIQEERNQITLKYLLARRELYKRDGRVEDHAKNEIAITEELHRQQMEKEQKFAQSVKKLREEYAKKSAAEVMAIEIDTLNAAREKGLVDEETYQKMRLQIRLKYQGADGKSGQIGEEKKRRTSEVLAMATPDATNQRTAESSGNDFGVSALATAASDIEIAKQTYANLEDLRQKDIISQEEYTNAVAELDKQRFERFAQGAQAAYATVGAIMQSLSAYQQASSRAEEAKLTAKYDAEIKAAEGNSEKIKQLEAEKAAALAEIKTKANKRAMAIEIAQATAAAAMAAMNAYKATVGIPVVGPVMAPIAAAAAAAFGAVQIATIVKQHEAQEAGYYEGGFTGGKQYRRRAGVVHEGEFVANHLAVQNPNILPVLQLLDHAQRTNTIASLTAADVSRAIAPTAQISAVSGATAATAPTVQVVPTEAPATLAAIRQLAEILAGGIEATVAIDGQNGVAHQLKKYQELKNRK